MQMNDDLAADPVNDVAAFPAQRPRHGRQRTRVGLLAVILIGADVAVLTEGAAHVAGGKEDGAGALRAPVEQLFPGVMEMGAHARARGEPAGTQLGARNSANPAIPRTKIAVSKHTVSKLAGEFQKAWSIDGLR